MRRSALAILGLWATALSSPLSAQYAATQDSTLRGLEKVYVNFSNPTNALAPAAYAQAVDFVTLELRKSGLRLTRDAADVDLSRDGILNVAFLKVARALSTDLTLRIDVEQGATLSRTVKSLQMVTWFYEDDRRNIVLDQVLQPMLRQGVDKFLNAWLAANGR